MEYHKPRRQVLYVWWTMAFFIALILSSIVSFIFPLYDRVWIGCVISILLLFSFFFSFYFPVKLSKAAFAFDRENLIIYSGVFCSKISYIRLDNVQFVTKTTNIIDRFFQISSAHVWTAGGREVVFGLSSREADEFVDRIAGINKMPPKSSKRRKSI